MVGRDRGRGAADMDGGARPRDRDDGIPPFYSFQNPYFIPALASPAMAVALPALVITLLSVVVGGASLVVRFRRARSVALGLGQLLGQDSSLAVAGATLAVAAAFQPARRRIQALVDRRFNRRRHDAAQTIQAFSARLREQVDLDTLSGELLMVIEQTMQPTFASLWLRQAALLRRRSKRVASQACDLRRRKNGITPFDCPRDNCSWRARPWSARSVE